VRPALVSSSSMPGSHSCLGSITLWKKRMIRGLAIGCVGCMLALINACRDDGEISNHVMSRRKKLGVCRK